MKLTNQYIQSKSTWYRKIAKFLFPLFLIGAFWIGFIPWQQTVTGTGQVTVLDPSFRPQNIQVPFNSRIQKWHVLEGDYVSQGDIIAELEDIDKEFLSPDMSNLTNQIYQAELSNQQIYQSKVQTLQNNIKNIEELLNNNIQEQENQIQIYRQELEIANLNYQRINSLNNDGLISNRQYELSKRDGQNAQNKLQQAKIKIQSLRATANQEITKLQSQILEARSSLAQSKLKQANINIKRQTVNTRTNFRLIKAPTDGHIVNVLEYGSGTAIKTGTTIATIQPKIEEQAVELLIRDIDIMLIQAGDKVRIEFAGWPMFYIPGLSEHLNIGTFGGVVKVIDLFTNTPGKFRILIIPDPKDEPWPTTQFLKIGTRSTGWILLDKVPFGYELWRNFNGFQLISDKLRDVKQDNIPVKIKSKK